MILPIYGYGEPVLRKVGEDITPEYPNLKENQLTWNEIKMLL